MRLLVAMRDDASDKERMLKWVLNLKIVRGIQAAEVSSRSHYVCRLMSASGKALYQSMVHR